MQLKMRALGALAGLLSIFALSGLAAAADRAYTEGVVVDVASIRTEPGMFDEYLKYLAGPYKQLMEEQKKAGIIVDYAVYAVSPRGPDDPRDVGLDWKFVAVEAKFDPRQPDRGLMVEETVEHSRAPEPPE